MSEHEATSPYTGWYDASGLPHLARAFRIALQPAKLVVALAALLITFAFGTLLDTIWVAADAGVTASDVAAYAGSPLTVGAELADGTGPFKVWRAGEQRAISSFVASWLPQGAGAFAMPIPPGRRVTTPFEGAAMIVRQAVWPMTTHPWYALVFGLGCLLIWSIAGGAVCRMAAVQFTRGEPIGVAAAIDYARGRWLGGFLAAPGIPLVLVLVSAALMAIGGAVLIRVPVLDWLGAVLFFLALFGGLLITLLLLGLTVGGHLFWPAIAVDGIDAFDAFSRSLNYIVTRVWRAVLYAIVAVAFGVACFVVVGAVTKFMLLTTHAVVDFGTKWWTYGNGTGKLAALWPAGGPSAVYAAPDWAQLPWLERIPALVIGVYVLFAVGLMWSFLASYYYTTSTIVYCLLRRDVDAIDLEDIQFDDQDEEPAARDETQDAATRTPEPADAATADTKPEPPPDTADTAPETAAATRDAEDAAPDGTGAPPATVTARPTDTAGATTPDTAKARPQPSSDATGS